MDPIQFRMFHVPDPPPALVSEPEDPPLTLEKQEMLREGAVADTYEGHPHAQGLWGDDCTCDCSFCSVGECGACIVDNCPCLTDMRDYEYDRIIYFYLEAHGLHFLPPPPTCRYLEEATCDPYVYV